QALPVRTSALALCSAVLALATAFTVVGTLAAVGLGIAALVSIGRQRDKLAGHGLAVFGIVAGAALTALTLLALTTSELFGLGGREALRELQNVPENPFLGGDEEDEDVPRRRRTLTQVEAEKGRALPPLDGAEGQEQIVDVRRAGQAWRFLVRVYRKKSGAL